MSGDDGAIAKRGRKNGRVKLKEVETEGADSCDVHWYHHLRRVHIAKPHR